MKFAHKLVAASLMAAAASGAFAQKGETVRIAFMDPLSGPFANVGQNQLKSWQFIAERYLGQQESGRREVRGRGLRQQGIAAGKPEHPQGRHRPGLPLRDPGQRLGRRHRHPGRRCQAQRAQPRQGSGVPQLRGRGSRADQREMRLLALPPGRRHQHEDGGADLLHEGPAQGQQGLPAQPELLARPAGRQVLQGRASRASAPT